MILGIGHHYSLKKIYLEEPFKTKEILTEPIPFFLNGCGLQ